MSHDKLAARLGTTRQTVISWENGVEPKRYADALAKFSGFPREAFLRREGEALAVETSLGLLRGLGEKVDQIAGDLDELVGLVKEQSAGEAS